MKYLLTITIVLLGCVHCSSSPVQSDSLEINQKITAQDVTAAYERGLSQGQRMAEQKYNQIELEKLRQQNTAPLEWQAEKYSAEQAVRKLRYLSGLGTSLPHTDTVPFPDAGTPDNNQPSNQPSVFDAGPTH